MKIWSQDKYINAWNFASRVHNGQLVPGGKIPYINHIGLVAMEAMAAVTQTDNINSPDLVVLCALLHDTIEDTPMTAADIEKEFGDEVCRGVQALTKDKNMPSKQDQMADSLRRISAEPKEVWMVKLCDRITNLQPPPSYWDKAKISTYKLEAVAILDALGESSACLASRLSSKIKQYEKFE